MTPALTRRSAWLVVAVTLLVAAPVMAQAPSPTETRLETERRQRRVVVRPSTPLDVVEHDTDTATADIEQRRREQETVRGVTRPAPRRPDLDYDVKSGIQSRRLNDALRGR
jgi:hypothetical protein